MNPIAPISLSVTSSILVLGICLYIILKGRIEWVIGAYLSIGMAGEGTILIFSIAHTYILIVTILGATIYYIFKNENGQMLPKHDQWIVLWMIFWWVWELILLIFGNSPYKSIILMSLVPRIIAPIPVILLFANNIKKVRSFAIAYMLISILSGLKIYFLNYGISLSTFLSDPTLRSYGIFFYSGKNYHWFSYPYAISLILIVVLLIENKSKYIRLIFMFSAFICIYFILLAGSRQTIFGVPVVLIFFGRWIYRYKKRNLSSKFLIYTVSSIFILLAYYLFIWAHDLIIRVNESGIGDSLDIISSRGTAWNDGINTFLRAPLFGSAFSMYGSHNLFIGTLAEQGIIGFIFLLGFLFFISKQTVGINNNKILNENLLWRMAFLCIILFGLIHSMASGSAVSVWHLYWPAAFLWHMKYSFALQGHLSQEKQHDL